MFDDEKMPGATPADDADGATKEEGSEAGDSEDM
jgi:hypothetical protein